jgi:hypothetical protein
VSSLSIIFYYIRYFHREIQILHIKAAILFAITIDRANGVIGSNYFNFYLILLFWQRDTYCSHLLNRLFINKKGTIYFLLLSTFFSHFLIFPKFLLSLLWSNVVKFIKINIHLLKLTFYYWSFQGCILWIRIFFGKNFII